MSFHITSQQEVPSFTIAEHDVYTQFHFPHKLFGRENELAEIDRCLDSVWKGGVHVLALSGNSGVGESSLSMKKERILFTERKIHSSKV